MCGDKDKFIELDEVVDYAIYLLNRCPTKSLNDITPQEAWSRRKPNVSHLKVFWSIGYVHVDDQVRWYKQKYDLCRLWPKVQRIQVW